MVGKGIGTVTTIGNRRIETAVLYLSLLMVLVVLVIYRSQPAFLALGGAYLLLAFLHLRRQSERSTDLSRSILQFAFDGVPDPAIIIDKNGHVKAMNKAAHTAFGCEISSDDAVPCYSIMQRLGVDCSGPDEFCTLASGQASRKIQELTDAAGETRLVEIRTTPLLDEGGEFVGVLEVAHDLNQGERAALRLRQAKENAERVSEAKSEFIATISHEVRTPMNAVMGMADLLQLTTLTRKQESYLRTIQSSGSMLLSLVNNALDYSELQEAELVVERRDIDVRELIQHVLEIMGFQAYSKGLELACRIEKNMPLCIIGDDARLQQVLVNLVSNGIRFTDKGEVLVNVQTRTDENGQSLWLCSVTDTGSGISDELKQQLFQPFINEGSGKPIRKHGSGLGLTICKWLVEGMGGNIGVDSKPGVGTCVWFTLPLQVAAVQVRSEPVRTDQLKGIPALIVHDNFRVASIMGEYLEDWGMSYDIVIDADAALERLRSAAARGQPYEVAVIDCTLPETDGLELAQQIRKNGDISNLPIVLLASIAHPLEIGQISSIGKIRCVNKPVLPAEFGSNLLKLLPGHDEADPIADAHNRVDAPGQDLRILIAEDNPINRQLLQGMLQSLGYQPSTVDDGAAVLPALDRHPYDLILMDCQMPGMDGDEVTRRIRQHPDARIRQITIIAISANVSAKNQQECREAGMDDFLAKPVRLRILQKKISHWCAHFDECNTSNAEPQARPALSSETEVQSHLLDRAGVDMDFLSGYIDMFLEDTATRLEILRVALEHNDRITLRRESHSLKGACLEMGASAMAAYCSSVCDAAEDGRSDEIAEVLPILREEFQRVRPIFEAAKIRLV